MLPRKNRLNKRDIESLFGKKQGNIKDRFFTLIYRGNSLNYSRFAAVVSKTISKKSAIRNRIKRRLKAIFLKNSNKIIQGMDIIVIVKDVSVFNKFSILEGCILSLIKKIT